MNEIERDPLLEHYNIFENVGSLCRKGEVNDKALRNYLYRIGAFYEYPSDKENNIITTREIYIHLLSGHKIVDWNSAGMQGLGMSVCSCGKRAAGALPYMMECEKWV